MLSAGRERGDGSAQAAGKHVCACSSICTSSMHVSLLLVQIEHALIFCSYKWVMCMHMRPPAISAAQLQSPNGPLMRCGPQVGDLCSIGFGLQVPSFSVAFLCILFFFLSTQHLLLLWQPRLDTICQVHSDQYSIEQNCHLPWSQYYTSEDTSQNHIGFDSCNTLLIHA